MCLFWGGGKGAIDIMGAGEEIHLKYFINHGGTEAQEATGNIAAGSIDLVQTSHTYGSRRWRYWGYALK